MYDRVIVTGSSSGIGLGIAKEFAKNKFRLILHGIENQEQGQSLVSIMKQDYGIECHYFKADLGLPEESRRLIEFAHKTWGGLDILVNNAGMQYVAPITEMPDEKWEQIINVNLSSVFYCCKAAWMKMVEQKFGRIINIASVHGLVASQFKLS
jgi:3-hydroxybutyrate dehydrogenase